MNNEKTKIKYFLYARKSTESEDRQVLSIDSQIEELKRVADENEIEIVAMLSESKLAKAPGRPVFNQMVERIHKGEAQGILCWKLDRLARNTVDGGKIAWLLQEGTIKHIQTRERGYLPTDNVLMMSVEFGMANQFIRDLSIGVKRGLDKKVRMGWMPGSVPLGYLNTKTEVRGENYIIEDPERFLLIRKAWDLMLTDNYVPQQILNKLNDEWGFRTRDGKRRGGKLMSRSTIYRIFTNPFYAGILPYKGAHTEGKHPAMVTVEEFDRVQALLGRKGKPRPNQHHPYAFTGMMKCGECDGLISATFQKKILKSTGQLKTYVLYYCIRARKEKGSCSQWRYTNAEIIEEQIEKEIEQFTILPEFKDWALAILAGQNNKEIEDRTKIYESQQNTVNDAQKQLDNLTQLRIRELIEDEEYTRERTRLKNEITRMRMKMKSTEDRTESWLELTEKTFEFACYAHKAFLYGDAETKKSILSAIGLNHTIKDHILSIQGTEWLVPIKEQYPAVEAQMLAFELGKNPMDKRQNEAFDLVCPQGRGRWDSNPRSLP